MCGSPRIKPSSPPPRQSEPLLTLSFVSEVGGHQPAAEVVVAPPSVDGVELHSALLADGPLLEMVIEASASSFYTEAVRSTYPDVLSAMPCERPVTPTSALYYPLTPSTVPSALPHLALDLLSLMERHSIPFTRRATVSSLLYVCNELQLPSLACLVLRKAHADGLALTSSLIDNAVTIACNSYHLHLALQALTWYRPLKLEAPIASFATLFNFALYGERHRGDAQLVHTWAESRGIRMTGWDGEGDGKGEAEDGMRRGGRSALQLSSASLTGGWLRDLTREGVEANPGPCRQCECDLSRDELLTVDEDDGTGKGSIMDKCVRCEHLVGFHLQASAAVVRPNRYNAHGRLHAMHFCINSASHSPPVLYLLWNGAFLCPSP